MTPCPYCGDLHGPRDLCQRAARGLSRRSFCFLFGAGVAGAVLAPFDVTRDLSPFVTRVYHLAHYFDPAELMFTTRDFNLRPGQMIRVQLPAPMPPFQGAIDRIEWAPSGAHTVHAVAPLTPEITALRDAYPVLAAARPRHPSVRPIV